MKTIITLLSLLLTFSISAQWQNEGAGNFSPGQVSYTDLKFDLGVPYIAYRDAGNSNRASVMTYDGTNWVNLGIAGFSPSGVSSTSLEFYNNFAHVAYVDGANANRVSVMAFDGTVWQDIGIPGFSGMNSDFVNLEFIGSEPYVAYQDGGSASKASVMKYSGGVWANVGIAGFSAGFAGDVSMTIMAGVPYVGFVDGAASNEATVMYFDGTNWVYLGTQAFTSGGIGEIVLENDGSNVYAAIRDGSSSNKASLLMFNGTNWVNIGSPGFSPSTASNIDITFDAGAPYVVFQDAGNGFKASVMTYDGTNWIFEGAAGFTNSQCVYNSIEFNAGTPYVAFQDYDGGNYTATVMKYIPCIDPETPTVSYSATTICQGESFTITIDAGNLNDATAWHVYAGGCIGASVANSPTGPFLIYPTGSATYSVRGEGACVGFIPCIANQAVNVTPVDTNVTFSGGQFSVGSGGATAYQWLDCNNAMAPWIGDTNQVFTPPSDGNYAVEVTENGCVDTSSCNSIINVGLSEVDFDLFQIYPNPASSNLSIHIPVHISQGRIEIYNVQGKLMYSLNYENQFFIQIETTNLPSGLYILNFINNSSNQSEKLTIQH